MGQGGWIWRKGNEGGGREVRGGIVPVELEDNLLAGVGYIATGLDETLAFLVLSSKYIGDCGGVVGEKKLEKVEREIRVRGWGWLWWMVKTYSGIELSGEGLKLGVEGALCLVCERHLDGMGMIGDMRRACC